MTRQRYGLTAQFTSAEALLEAVKRTQHAGFRRIEAYTPYPVDEVTDLIAHRNWLPPLVLLGGITGALTAYSMQVYIAIFDYPINVGGRPLHSWPSFVIVTFELTILFASLTAFLGAVVLGGMPKPYDPVANAPGFEAASSDRFILVIEARDPLFDPDRTAEFLASLEPERIEEVET